jgi:hypothetical protein
LDGRRTVGKDKGLLLVCSSGSACNPSYSRGRDQEDHGSKPAWANSSRDSISKIPITKRAGRVTEVVECLPSEAEALSSNPSTTTTKKAAA